MDEKLVKKLKKKLESEKKKLTRQLSSFAKKDTRIKDNWRTRIPLFNMFGSFTAEEDAERREEYENRLPVEHALEKRLQSINDALEKIENGKYGKCEQCGEDIEQKRLKAVPEAEICLKCARAKKEVKR